MIEMIALHISGTIHYMIVIRGAKGIIISPGTFLNVKILIFAVVKGLKWQKMVQNVENFCLLRIVFQEPYII